MWGEKNLENFVSSKWESVKPTTFKALYLSKK